MESKAHGQVFYSYKRKQAINDECTPHEMETTLLKTCV